MSTPLIIYLSNDGLAIYRWERKKLHVDLRVVDAEQAEEPLRQFFEQHSNPVRIILDLLEETYTLESLPHLNGRDRQALIQRKQKQIFPGLNYVYTAFKGRSLTERRDDLVLFAAITQYQELNRWLQILNDCKVVVAGIYSLPALLEKQACQLQGKVNKLLISVSVRKKGVYLRQSFFKNNLLVLSRFKQIGVTEPQKIAEEIREDVERSLRFAARRFAMTDEKNLSAYFFGTADLGREFFKLIDFKSIKLAPVFTIASAFARLHGDEVDENCGFSPYVASLNARPLVLKTHYQDSAGYFFYRHYLLNKTLYFTSVLLLILTLAFAGNTVLESLEMDEQTGEMQNQAMKVLEKLTKTPETPSFHGYDPFQLQAFLQQYHTISRNILSPAAIMQSISNALEHFPNIQLTALKWGIQQQAQQLSNNNDMAMTSAQIVTDDGAATHKTITLQLEARIKSFNGDYRQALKRIEQFRLRLQADSKISQVKSLQLPINVANNQELAGNLKAQPQKGQFTLEMQWLR